MEKSLVRVAAIFLLWALFTQAVRGAIISSITFDEGPHLAVGYTFLRTGDLRLQPIHIHPPLANMAAAAALLLDPTLPDPRAIDGWEIASLSAVTDTVIWQYPHPKRLALAGRLPIILMAVLLGAFVYRWAADLAGKKAGLLALFLFALDPNIIAHSQVVTTDMAITVFGFITLYLNFKFKILDSKKRWLIGTGIMLGTTLATKVSAGLLLALLAIIMLLTGKDAPVRRSVLVRRSVQLATIGLIAFGVLWAVYGFEIGRVPGIPLPLPAATHFKLYQSLQLHYDEGHSAFLMGMNSTRGWPYYFPIAFLIKTPLPTLILLALSITLSTRANKINHGKVARWSLGLFPIAYFVTALFSSVDIGYRHLLPILPFIFVFIGVQLSAFSFQLPAFKILWPVVRGKQVANSSPRHPVTLSPPLLASALFVWYVASAALIFPHNLAYFNELVGGPDHGYHWLVDSNLDWGQNLNELKAWLDARGIQNVFFSHYSPARPEVYDIQASLLPPSPRAVPFAPFEPAPGWYAIGATTLQGSYMADVNTLAYFRTMTPAARVGHALFVYKVKPYVPANWVAVCSSRSPEEIAQAFGRTDLRLVYFDCAQSWVYPTGPKPGACVLPAAMPPPSEANLVLETHLPSTGATLDKLYRMETTLVPSQTVAVTMAGAPLVLVGYRIDQTSARAGETIELWTLWKVQAAPNRLLSLMAHLVGPDGIPLAVGDGLGVPIEQWQPGDIIAQRHQFAILPETPAGVYSINTGAYWLDTIERWTMQNQQGVVSNYLTLTTIGVHH